MEMFILHCGIRAVAKKKGGCKRVLRLDTVGMGDVVGCLNVLETGVSTYVLASTLES